MEEKKLFDIVRQFCVEGEPLSVKPLGEGGFINDTYKVVTHGDSPDYLLQRKNGSVFPDIPAIMDNTRRVTDHLRQEVGEAGGDTLREVLTPVAAVADPSRLWVRDAGGEYWTMCVFIPGSVTLQSVDSPAVAEAGGRGIGRFHRMMADFQGELAPSIPGFHNLRLRFSQWDEAVKADRVGRVGELAEEIGWIESRRGEIMAFQEKIERGEFPLRATHNDTKISNFLFNEDLSPLCVIDLDTMMTAPVFYDFGDAIRSYTNTGAEDDRDLSRVTFSREYYDAYTRGFLDECGAILTEEELKWLPYAGRFITFEQVLRFLMDYIDGDRYYKISSPDHNLVRARAQHRLLESMEASLPMPESLS